MVIMYYKKYNVQKEDNSMQKHKFWAWAAVICMLMAILTGYKHE